MKTENLSSTQSIRSFLEFHFPKETNVFFDERSTALLNKFNAKERSPEDYILVYRDSKPIWSFTIFPDGDNVYGIQTPKILSDIDVSTQDWSQSMSLLKNRLSHLGAKQALLRFTAAKITQQLPVALEAIGFKKHHDRIEYKTLLSELPKEAGTPLIWKAVGTDGIDLEFAAKIMSRCSAGDPNWETGFDTLESIKVDLADDELYNKQDAIHIGYFNNEPVAFVFAQTNVDTGWARLTYVGIVPEARGKGLGLWMHRHGIEMMRAQGGIEYHGGTVSVNKAMIKTFISNGCKELRRVQDWTFTSELK